MLNINLSSANSWPTVLPDLTWKLLLGEIRVIGSNFSSLFKVEFKRWQGFFKMVNKLIFLVGYWKSRSLHFSCVVFLHKELCCVVLNQRTQTQTQAHKAQHNTAEAFSMPLGKFTTKRRETLNRTGNYC